MFGILKNVFQGFVDFAVHLHMNHVVVGRNFIENFGESNGLLVLNQTVEDALLVNADTFVLELAHLHQQLQNFLFFLRVLAKLMHEEVNQVISALDFVFFVENALAKLVVVIYVVLHVYRCSVAQDLRALHIGGLALPFCTLGFKHWRGRGGL